MRRAVAVPTMAVHGVRSINTRNQYNPIHNFDVTNEQQRAQSFEQFRNMTSNPGPIRIGYSIDYLDWYFRAYNDKVRFAQEKAKKQEKFPDGGVSGESLHRIKSSAVRGEGEGLKATSQTAIDECAVQLGMLDLYERLPQFPTMHIDNCTDFHIKEILRTRIFELESSASRIWELALMYRALILERRASYPESFSYIVEAASAEVEEGSPMAAMQEYYSYIVKKYHVENSAEVHVALDCLEHRDASQLMLTVPAPKEDPEGTTPPKRPTEFPALEELMKKENLGLARCVVFGEFNTVADADPFEKFPNAVSHVTRPRAEELGSTRHGGGGAGLAINTKRGKLFAPLNQTQLTAAETRIKDAQRLQTTMGSRDSNYTRELEKHADENPAAFQGDGQFYNPHAIRGDVRDSVSRRMLSSLRKYETGKSMTSRPSLLDGDSCRRSRVVTKDSTLLPTKPTVAHFSALLLGDKHVSFLDATGSNAELGNCVGDAARQMFKLAVEYHDAACRQVNRQKVLVALSLLDSAVEKGLRESVLVEQVRSLGVYRPWVDRPLDDAGFPTSARFDDYKRWVAAISPVSAPST